MATPSLTLVSLSENTGARHEHFGKEQTAVNHKNVRTHFWHRPLSIKGRLIQNGGRNGGINGESGEQLSRQNSP